MRNAAGDVADGAHLLAMCEALLKLAVLGDVNDIGHGRAARRVERHEHVGVLGLLFAFGAGEFQRDRLVDRLHQRSGGAAGSVIFGNEEIREA